MHLPGNGRSDKIVLHERSHAGALHGQVTTHDRRNVGVDRKLRDTIGRAKANAALDLASCPFERQRRKRRDIRQREGERAFRHEGRVEPEVAGDGVGAKRQGQAVDAPYAIGRLEHGLARQRFAGNLALDRNRRRRIGHVGLAVGRKFKAGDLATRRSELVAGDRRRNVRRGPRAIGADLETDCSCNLRRELRDVGEIARQLDAERIGGERDCPACVQPTGLRGERVDSDNTGCIAADGCHHVDLLRECSTRGLGQQRRQQVGLDSELQRSVGERDVALNRSAQRIAAQGSLVEVDAIPGDCRGRVGFQRSSQQAGNRRVGTAGALGRCRQRHWSGTIGDVETVGMQRRFNAVQFGGGGRDLGEACGRIDRRRIACTEGAQRGLADRGRHRRVALAEGQCRRRAARGKLH